MSTNSVPRRANGFTLVELLIVIGIIGVLVAILVPVVSMMRVTGQSTDSAALVRALDNAARAYESDWKKYPGIFPESMLGPSPFEPLLAEGSAIAVQPSTPVFIADPDELEMVTGTENLVLSLLGGIIRNDSGEIIYDPAAIGRGPVSLRSGDSKTYSPYVEIREQDLSMHTAGDGDVSYAGLSSGDIGKRWGRFVEDSGAAQDSMIPEFLDRFSDPMPILYLRANTRVPRVGSSEYSIADLSATNTRAVYLLDQVFGYTAPQANYSVGTGRDGVDDAHTNAGAYHGLQVGEDADDTNGVTDLSTQGPFDGVPYLADTSSSTGAARKADSYVIISAGPDRVYGTRDDITSFGKVVN